MTRKEQIEQAVQEAFLKRGIDKESFRQGIEWADEHPNLYSVTRKAVEREREYLIEKACEWLKNNHADIYIRYIRGYDADDEIELLKQYMDEQQ